MYYHIVFSNQVQYTGGVQNEWVVVVFNPVPVILNRTIGLSALHAIDLYTLTLTSMNNYCTLQIVIHAGTVCAPNEFP